MYFPWKPNTKCTEKPQSFISTHPFSDVSFFCKNISIPRWEPANWQKCCLPPLSFKISLRNTSFHISLNCLGFYLSPECLLNFFRLAYSTMCGKKFSIYGVDIPRKCIESMMTMALMQLKHWCMEIDFIRLIMVFLVMK